MPPPPPPPSPPSLPQDKEPTGFFHFLLEIRRKSTPTSSRTSLSTSTTSKTETTKNGPFSATHTTRSWSIAYFSSANKFISMKFLCLPTIITSGDSCIQRVWAPDKFVRPKNSLDTTSESIIARARLMGLLMPYPDTLNEVHKEKRPSEPRTSKSCTTCSPC